mmetsp:Transcript_69658/g.137866  ORF Transcript_69658/g.137866 Transcript_69658/m.137866 type:complete len:214 (-) Transcript_69658:1800-2441(-)
MLKHSEIITRPSSPTAFRLRAKTCSSCVSAAPLSRKSSKQRPERPTASSRSTSTLLYSMAAPICAMPRGCRGLPERPSSSSDKQPRINSPMANAACSVQISFSARCSDRKALEWAAPRQSSVAPSLPKELRLSEIRASAGCCDTASERLLAALPSAEHPSSNNARRKMKPGTAVATIRTPSEPSALLERSRTSSRVLLNSWRARQPVECRPMV